jgi:hypothetical protein
VSEFPAALLLFLMMMATYNSRLAARSIVRASSPVAEATAARRAAKMKMNRVLMSAMVVCVVCGCFDGSVIL